ncbi:MAG: hypothetical protein M1827_003180 [Pycnora praestabilis]|nr:MAG: hypothetical protein M1827_003180 [Pycnora praestabilis]
MGRLNYTNRKVEGVKLGQIIEKDLLKRIHPGPGSKSAIRDPSLELIIAGRNLSDNGLLPVTNGLFTAYSPINKKWTVTHLEELCLSGNCLTALSLISLAGMIRLAAEDLMDLDLSCNEIEIRTSDDVFAWESFLTALKQCFLLRKLDLSGNPIGSKGFEILTRFYLQENPSEIANLVGRDHVLGAEEAKPVELEPDIPFEAMSSDFSDRTQTNGSSKTYTEGPAVKMMDEAYNSFTASSPTTDLEESMQTMSFQQQPTPFDVLLGLDDPYIKRTDESTSINIRGLHTIPYIVISDTSMTDLCALHLSYILVRHHLPVQLRIGVSPAKAGAPADQLEEYDTKSGCRGIIYLPNSGLGSAGLRLLELAEAARNQLIDDPQGDDSIDDSLSSSWTLVRSSRAVSDAGSSPITTKETGRRRSTVAVNRFEAISSDSSSITDLERAITKVQNNTLRAFGVHSVCLWSVALKMLAVSRAVLLDTSMNAKDPRADAPDASLHYVSKLTTLPSNSGEPIFIVTGLTIAPMTPEVAHRRRKSSHTALSTSGSVQTSPLSVNIKDEPHEFEGLLGGLGWRIWLRILIKIAGADSILTERQQLAILRWALNRNTLTKEREALGKTEGVQIWHVLEGIGCLAYDAAI